MKSRKSLRIISLIIFLIFLTNLNFVQATNTTDSNIIIYIGGDLITNYYDGQKAFFDNNGRIQAPLRTLVEGLGFQVNYDNGTKTITIPTSSDAKGPSVILQLNSNKIKTPNKIITMDTVATTVNGRTYVPIRFVSEALGYTVGYKKVTDNSGASTGKATHIVTVDKGENQGNDDNGDLSNNIIGVKEDANLYNDAKAFWDGLDQSKFHDKTATVISYGPIEITNIGNLIITFGEWNDTVKTIIKTVLKNTVQSPDSIYNNIVYVGDIVYSTQTSEAEKEKIYKQTMNKWITVGNVEYIISPYELQFRNK